MATSSASRRLTIVAVVQVAFLALMFAAVATPFWEGQSVWQQVAVALVLWGVGMIIGWRGAIWARAARETIPEPPGIQAVRRRFMARSRAGFATVFAIVGGVMAPFVSMFAALPTWVSVLLGAVGGCACGLVMGHLGGAQTWISETPRFTKSGTSNKSLERTRER